MTLIRQDPWSVMTRLNEELNRLMPYRTGRGEDGDNSSIATSLWVPPVDIIEEQDRFVLLADVPGVAASEIEVTMDAGVLTLKGERRDDSAGYRDRAKRLERVSGTFYRRFALPDGVDPERITAQGRNGVLEVSIPKAEKAKPRRIEIQ
jgi:HSP20 family protein